MKTFRSVSVVVLAALMLPAALYAEDLAAVEAQIKAKSEKLTGYKAKQRQSMEMTNPIMSIKSKGEGTVEFRRDGGKILARTELRTKMTRTVSDKATDVEQSSLVIIDGQFMYTLTDSGGQKRAIKSDIDLQYAPLPDQYLASLKRGNTLAVLADETIGGRKAWVIEAKPTKAPMPGGSTPVANKVYFDKDTGVVLKTEALSADGKPVQMTEYVDHQFDVKVEAERFRFEPPAGVEVVDQTNRGAAPPAAPPAQPPATQPGKP
jgi:outer membrane lipoprotein-sorting protein